MSRNQYLFKKISWALFTIAFVLVLNFFLFRILPGDPARSGIHDPRLKKGAIEAIRVRYGLDKPVINVSHACPGLAAAFDCTRSDS